MSHRHQSSSTSSPLFKFYAIPHHVAPLELLVKWELDVLKFSYFFNLVARKWLIQNSSSSEAATTRFFHATPKSPTVHRWCRRIVFWWMHWISGSLNRAPRIVGVSYSRSESHPRKLSTVVSLSLKIPQNCPQCLPKWQKEKICIIQNMFLFSRTPSPFLRRLPLSIPRALNLRQTIISKQHRRPQWWQRQGRHLISSKFSPHRTQASRAPPPLIHHRRSPWVACITFPRRSRRRRASIQNRAFPHSRHIKWLRKRLDCFRHFSRVHYLYQM